MSKINRLTDKQIAAIQKHAKDGMAYHEIADKLNIAYQSVRYHALKATKGKTKKKVSKKKVARKLSVKHTTTKTTEATYESKPKVQPIHRIGNEIHNRDIEDVRDVAHKIRDAQKRHHEKEQAELVAYQKESSSDAIFMLIAATALIGIGYLIAGM